MNSVRTVYSLTRVCAAIVALAASAMAEAPQQENANELEAADPQGSDEKKEPLPGAPKVGTPEAGVPPEGGPPTGSPPVNGPPGAGLEAPLRLSVLTRAEVGLTGSKLDEPFSTALMGIGVSGNVYGPLNHTVNLAASYDPRNTAGVVTLLDVIVRFEPIEALNVWLGRMIVPVDRSGLAGPWFTAPWIFGGIGHVDGQVALPRAGFLGRGDGATVWGTILGGHVKYYASAVDLVIPEESPLLSGRLSFSLFNPEPAFYNASTYFGKDILSLGVGAQSKKGGSVNPVTEERGDYSEYNADLLFEKDLGAAGVIDLEGAYYKFNGANERTSSSYSALVSYLAPIQVAGARLQPLGRVQQALPADLSAPYSTLIDAQLGIIWKGHMARLALGYRWAQAGPVESSAIFLGLQLLRL